MNPESVQIIITPKELLSFLSLDSGQNSIILIGEGDGAIYINYEIAQLKTDIKFHLKSHGITHVALISAEDEYPHQELLNTLETILSAEFIHPLTYLIPHLIPPKERVRVDGCIRSVLFSRDIFDQRLFNTHSDSFETLIYYLSFKTFNKKNSQGANVRQIGAAVNHTPLINLRNENYLKKSLLIMPHKGSVELLGRSLIHLNQSKYLPREINLCFDDKKSFSTFQPSQYQMLSNRLTCYLNEPNNVGPYLARHYSVLNTEKKYIFFHDSDDISVPDRFIRQINELKNRKLDIVGSHELRVDQFLKIIKIIRYPLNARNEKIAYSFNQLFHPTSLITRSAYLKAGGFSTDRKFGNDTQFFLRAASLSLKIGNIDDFLYIRFKRPNSLTTSVKTQLGNRTRTFLHWLWKNEIKLIFRNKMRIEDSSVGIKTHNFEFKLVKKNISEST